MTEDKIMEALATSAKAVETSYAEGKPKKIRRPSGYMDLDGYLLNEGMYTIMIRNVKKCVNTLLLGPTGVGKTELVDAVAKQLGLPLTIFDMGTMSDPIVSLVGSHTITVVDGVTQSSFKRSRFSEVIQKPGIVLLDELSRASAQANNLLFPVLDFRKQLAMEYDFHDSTPVAVHPQCVFIATANLGSEYTGASKLDRALVDRFMLLQVKALETQPLRYIFNNMYELEVSQTDNLIDIYEKINIAHSKFEIDFSLSIRHLKNIFGLVKDGFTPFDAFVFICEGLGRDSSKVIKEIMKS